MTVPSDLIPHSRNLLVARRSKSKRYIRLHLETTVATATTGVLDLAGLGAGAHVRLDVAVSVDGVDGSAVAEVLVGLTGSLGATEENAVGSLGVGKGELVEGDALTARSGDAGAGTSSELESANLHGRQIRTKADIVSDGASDNSGLAVLATHVLGEAGHRQRRAVGLGHEQALEDKGVVLGISTARKEAVELHNELQVHILRFRGAPGLVTYPAAACYEINW